MLLNIVNTSKSGLNLYSNGASGLNFYLQVCLGCPAKGINIFQVVVSDGANIIYRHFKESGK